MNTTPELDAIVLLFIQRLDTTAFEAYAQGEISGEQYRLLCKKITNIQRLTVDLLYMVEFEDGVQG